MHMQIESDLHPPSIDRSVRAIVSELVGSTRRPQRELLARTGLSKDQLSRALRGARQMELAEAVAILDAADFPARGALALALFERPDLAIEWSHSGMAAFFEALIAALPEALIAELGEDFDRINPRWGAQTAKFVAQRLALHVEELIEREERLGEFRPPRALQSD